MSEQLHYSPESDKKSLKSKIQEFGGKIAKYAAIVGIGALILAAL